MRFDIKLHHSRKDNLSSTARILNNFSLCFDNTNRLNN